MILIEHFGSSDFCWASVDEYLSIDLLFIMSIIFRLTFSNTACVLLGFCIDQPG